MAYFSPQEVPPIFGVYIPQRALESLVMRSLRFALHPILLVFIGVASGALTLGASTLGWRAEGASMSSIAKPIAARRSESPAAVVTESERRYRWFPAMYTPAGAARRRSYDLTADFSREPTDADRASLIPAVANNQILAFYGKPDSRRMGILGEYSKEDLWALLEGYAKLYDEQNGEDGVIPAFYLIYGTCWPEGEIGYLKDSVVQDYIEFARTKGMLVFVDHQIGKYPVDEAMKRLLPWLKYPNVHLAIDPEWRTVSPMKVIGGVSAEEINAAEETMSDYMKAEGIPGVKMLVVHQFQGGMIANREKVRADYDCVLLIHTADGFGPPALKRWSYSTNAKAGNMPLKGFKLFFKTDLEGAGYDDPLLLPAEVLALEPRPRLIIYQ
jgi:hypothetical protein